LAAKVATATIPIVFTGATSCAPGATLKARNLTIVPGRFQARNEQTADLVPPLVKAALDAIMSAGDVITRALLKASRTIPIMGGPRSLGEAAGAPPPHSEHL
jgi:hypothetical protein